MLETAAYYKLVTLAKLHFQHGDETELPLKKIWLIMEKIHSHYLLLPRFLLLQNSFQ